MSELYSDSIYWIEVDKIEPNPYQPRREFEPGALDELADSIRQYGILQPLTVTRVETHTDTGMQVSYELIAGERRLRASKLAGLSQVPVVVRKGDSSKTKLELAIIENLQREDLNPVDRARAFNRLAEEFKMTHGQIGKKMGKSREYVSNTLRLLKLPDFILDALAVGKITEGHTRPLMMLKERPDEQKVLLQEIIFKKLKVREAERAARTIARDKIRSKKYVIDPELEAYEKSLASSLGTRVHIEQSNVGGKIVIDFFSPEDLATITDLLKTNQDTASQAMLERFMQRGSDTTSSESQQTASVVESAPAITEPAPTIDRGPFEPKVEPEDKTDADLYSMTNFSI